MPDQPSQPARRRPALGALAAAAAVAAGVVTAVRSWPDESDLRPPPDRPVTYQPRTPVEASGYTLVRQVVTPWAADAPLADIAALWRGVGYRHIGRVDRAADAADTPAEARVNGLIEKALMYNYEGEPGRAYECLGRARAVAEADRPLAEQYLYTLIYLQGVAALRRGETENCILCRGESSCILPIAPAAVHTRPDGSRLAAGHFAEYLRQFPDDLEARWLLNVAHMTLGTHPAGIDPEHRLSLDHWRRGEFDLGRFRDVGHLVGVNRLNQAGGAVMDDFDGDGRLDVVCTSFDPTEHMAFYRNAGDGTFADRTAAAGLADQLGGLNVVHADYDNDGRPDLFVPRGAWVEYPMRPSLLRNTGAGTFEDVTRAAGLVDPVNSNSAAWADYDNDGFLDLFVACERQPNRLYRNRGDGTFAEVAARAGVRGPAGMNKGCTWIDHDNDGYPDLYVNNLTGPPALFHNDRTGTFTEVSLARGVDGPRRNGFSCWAFDYDNDGFLDLFATSYEFHLGEVVNGLIGRPHGMTPNKLFRNLAGQGFRDVTRDAGLDLVFATMGSNYGDFDNDGYLDFYLGTGDPNLATLIPNRLFKNVAGERFAEVTASSGTGHLQKGHGVACGDWDRDGDVDIFVEMGGATNGDKYHNVLFQNPGQGNTSLTVKLVGVKTNRSAIGARIKVVTAGDRPLTVHRHVSAGSSFGGNPLEQTVGLGQADRVASLEVYWPASRTTQVFYDVAAGQAVEVTEFAKDYRKLDRGRIELPK